jgi:hypothetical protein
MSKKIQSVSALIASICAKRDENFEGRAAKTN